MEKNIYLQEISPFIDYLASVWSSGFTHTYTIRYAPWINQVGTDQWCCSSLSDAQAKYWWHGNYGVAQANLALYCQRWKSAVHRGSNLRAKAVIRRVFKWGGVDKGTNTTSVNTHPNFIHWMTCAMTQLVTGNDSVPDFTKAGLYKMNSAYTKAYAIMDDRLIIYDGRVGAALGLLAARYLTSPAQVDAPALVPFELIKFPWGAERQPGQRFVRPSTSSRNPSLGRYVFPQLRNDNRQHARWAVRASWLVEELVKRINALSTSSAVTIRDIEAALFMVGYRVR